MYSEKIVISIYYIKTIYNDTKVQASTCWLGERIMEEEEQEINSIT